MKENKIEKNYPFDKDKLKYVPMIHEAFPESNLETRVADHLYRQNIHKEVSEKFNGKIIMNLLNIEGKELGKFINDYKEWMVGEDGLNEFILNSSQDIIEMSIVEYFDYHFIKK